MAIEFHELTKRYSASVILDKLDNHLPENSIIGLQGANGAGKSTLLKILATIIKPSSGTATVAGIDIMKNPVQVRQNIGFVYQDIALDPMLSAFENLRFATKLYNLNTELRLDRINELLTLFKIQDIQHQKIPTLSGGQRRLVDITRGLLVKPKVLLLDEPTSGLDSANRQLVLTHLKALHDHEAITVLYSSHHPEELEICTHVYKLDYHHLERVRGS